MCLDDASFTVQQDLGFLSLPTPLYTSQQRQCVRVASVSVSQESTTSGAVCVFFGLRGIHHNCARQLVYASACVYAASCHPSTNAISCGGCPSLAQPYWRHNTRTAKCLYDTPGAWSTRLAQRVLLVSCAHEARNLQWVTTHMSTPVAPVQQCGRHLDRVCQA